MTVILDNTPPSIGDPSPTGSLIQKTNRVTFTVTVEDPGSGVKEVRLTIDGIYQGLMTKRGNNYTRTVSLDEGDHSWMVEVVDNLGNSGIQNYSLELIVDNTLPTISGLYESSPAWGESTIVSCQVSDEESGVKEVFLYHSTDGTSWSRIAMNLIGNRYYASIPSQPPFTKVRYYVEASDNVGNISQTSIFEYTVGLPTWLYILIVLIAVLAISSIFLLRRRKRPRPSPTPKAPEPKPEEPPVPPPAEEAPLELQEPVSSREETKLPSEEEEAPHEESYEPSPGEAPSEEEEMPSIFEEEPQQPEGEGLES